MKQFISALLISAPIIPALNAQPRKAIEDTWIPNNVVRHITRGDGKVFLSGAFDWFGPRAASSMAVFNTTLSHDASYPKTPDYVRCSVSDDAGGWFIAGENYIAHIKSDKTIEDFPVAPDGIVNAIAKAGNTLYVGGYFSFVNGVARNYLAAFDLTTRNLTNWNPDPNENVSVIQAFGSVVYVGGGFSSIGGQPRNNIAALDMATGLATSWNANVDAGSNFITAIVADAGSVYFSGGFPNVGGAAPARRYLVGVNTTTGALLSFDPLIDNHINVMVYDGSTLYIAGTFTHINGVNKVALAALDGTSGSLTSFDVALSDFNSITAMALDGQKLFFGGDFRTVNGQERHRLAAVNKITGVSEPTTATKLSHDPSTISVSGGSVLAGGYFEGISGNVTLTGCVALDEATGQGINWNPEFPIPPQGIEVFDIDLHYQNNKVYYRQALSNGKTVLGAVNTTDGAAIPTWSVTLNGRIDAWTFSDDALYLGGEFSQVNATAVDNLAAVDLATGATLPWAVPSAPNYSDGANINSMVVHHNVLYVAGTFNLDDGGIERFNLGAWDAITGSVYPWAPTVSVEPFETVFIGAVNDDYVYLSGDVMLRVSADTGVPDGWEVIFPLDGRVNSVVLRDASVFIAGGFSPGLVRADKTTAAITGWQPDLEDVFFDEASVLAMDISATKLFAGGDFRYVTGSVTRSHYAEYPFVNLAIISKTTATVCTGTLTTFTVSAPGPLSYQWQKRNQATSVFEDLTDTGEYSGSTTQTLSITSVNSGNINFRCRVFTADGEVISNVVTLAVNAPPSKPAISITGKVSLCSGESATLDAPSGSYTYLWSTGATTKQITVTAAGSYTVVLTDSNGCSSMSSDPMVISTGLCNQPPQIQISSVSTIVNGVITENLEGLLMDPDNNLDLSTLRIIVPPASGASASIDEFHFLIIDYRGINFAGTEEVTLELCDLAGSYVQKVLTIEVTGELFVFNGISPNGDGKNDVFVIQSINVLPETKKNTVTVFNRWGDVVFEVQDYDNSIRVFRGENKNGDLLPPGTYYYRIAFANGNDAKTGFISLRR